jgi:transposase
MLEKEKPPIVGMIQRGGQVVLHMLENVRQKTIKPLIQETVLPGTLVLTDEYDIDYRLPQWVYDHKAVCHSAREHARDEDGDGCREVHVNTIEGFGPYCVPGCGLTEGSLRSIFPSISAFSSSFITQKIEGNGSWMPY